MNDTYNVPVWAAYALFAIVTIFLGAIIGLVFVCIVDCVWPHNSSPRKSFTETSKLPVVADYPDEHEDLIESDGGAAAEEEDNKSTSDGEKYSGSDSDDEPPTTEDIAAGDRKSAGSKGKTITTIFKYVS